MNRRVHGGIVDKSHNRLSALFDDKGGARRYAIVPNEIRRAFVRIDLVLEVVDIDLIVVDGLAADRVCDSPRKVSGHFQGYRSRLPLTALES